MMRSQSIRTTIAVCVLTAATGCSQQYNGAWAFSNPADEQALLEKAEAAKREEAAARAASEKAAVAEKKASESKKSEKSASKSSKKDVPQPAAARTDAMAPLVDITKPLPAKNESVAPAPMTAEPKADATASAAEKGGSADLMRPLSLFGQIPGRSTETASSDGEDNVRRVTFATEGSDFDPSLDPTGEWLVYSSTQHRKTSDIYLKRVNGTTVTQLTNDPANDVMPTFSSDGKRVAFASDRTGNWDIYLMNAGGGQPIQLTNDSTDDVHPSFSPDGKQLVYCSHGSQSGQWELVVIDVENPATKRFIGFGLLPSWSPVENKIVFQRARERGTKWFSIWTVDYVNGEGTRPTEIAASSNAAAITPSWSPDGKHIVFCTVLDPNADDQNRPKKADVWIVGADGTSRANLTRSEFTNLQPVWSKDGGIFFVSNRGKAGTENVFALRPDRTVEISRFSSQPAPVAAAPKPAPAVAQTPAASPVTAEAKATSAEPAPASPSETALAPDDHH